MRPDEGGIHARLRLEPPVAAAAKPPRAAQCLHRERQIAAAPSARVCASSEPVDADTSQRGPGVAAGSNNNNDGPAMATQRVIIVEDDVFIRFDLMTHLMNAGHSVVGGAMGLSSSTALERAIHLSKFFWLLPGLNAGRRSVVCTANASYDRAAWNAAGPFDDELFMGDALLAMRAAARGHAPWFEPAAIVEHSHEGTAWMYVRQFFRRGQEFAVARAAQQAWAGWRIAAHLAAGPLVPLLVLARTGACAARSGWTSAFIISFFYQLAFRVAWSVGEMASQVELLTHPGIRGHSKAYANDGRPE